MAVASSLFWACIAVDSNKDIAKNDKYFIINKLKLKILKICRIDLSLFIHLTYFDNANFIYI
jgi:hypothetical protein